MPFLYLLQKNHIYQVKHRCNNLFMCNINILWQGVKMEFQVDFSKHPYFDHLYDTHIS